MSGRRDNPVIKFFGYMVRVLFVYIPGWLIFVPLSILIPKKKGLVVFIGRDKGRFVDNIKYLFIYAFTRGGVPLFFITEEKYTYYLLKSNELPVIFHPSFKSIFYMLRADLLIVDNRLWIRKYKFHLLYKTKKVQLWHGVGFKRIEADNPSFKNRSIFRIINILRGRLPWYDLLVSTSQFYTENVFKKSMKVKEIKEFGYPRNDVFFREPDELDLLEADRKLIDKVKKFKQDGYRLIVYTPTFRDFTENEPIEGGFLDVERLKEFALNNRLIFIVKFHPEVKIPARFSEIFPVFFYDKGKDIYPLIPLSDLLITDYSSIYMDYLLTGKPVIFFPYDYETYVRVDREIQFDYDWITPGPKCYTQEELENEIKKILIEGEDRYAEKREEILNIAFKYRDGKASERIWNYIKDKFLR